MTKQDQIEEIIETVCDEYCRFAAECSGDELDERCDACVLNDLRQIGEED